jgi:site-specific DNA-adenine methylase
MIINITVTAMENNETENKRITIVKPVKKEVIIKCEKWSDALEYAKGIRDVYFSDPKYEKKEFTCNPINIGTP